MTDETTQQVQVTHGPYAGQRLTMSKTDAAGAISEGWAVDPFKPTDPDEEPKQLTDEERLEIVKKAEHAAKALRGEKDDDEPEEKHGKAHKPVERDMKPAAGDEYETRSAPKRK